MPDSITAREDAIVEEFALFDDWMSKYEYLIELGESIPLIDADHKDEAHRIKGCQSQVWLRSELADGAVHYRADSDAQIPKGLAALLIRVLNEQPAESIATAELTFLDRIGMDEHLSPTRKNGLHAMMQRMKLEAMQKTGS